MRERLFFLQRQFLVFVSGGVLSALVDIGLMQLLLRRGGITLTTATTAGFAAGLLVNYAFHARVTFARMAQRHSLLRFGCVVVINYGITLLVVALAHALLDMPLAGKLLSLPLVAANGFLLSKYWVFK